MHNGVQHKNFTLQKQTQQAKSKTTPSHHGATDHPEMSLAELLVEESSTPESDIHPGPVAGYEPIEALSPRRRRIGLGRVS